jgi:hypothetical protein
VQNLKLKYKKIDSLHSSTQLREVKNVNIGVAIGKPFSNIKNLIIGIVLLLIPLANILIMPGYLLRIVTKTINKDNALPGFENIGELVVNSIKLGVVVLIYLIIGSIISAILALVPAVGPLLLMIWSIAFGFIVLSAVMTLAKAGDIKESLNVPEVAKKAFKMDFIIAVLVGGAISGFILGIVGFILLLVFGAVLITALTSGDPALLSGLVGTSLIGVLVLMIVFYIVEVFSLSLAAESYPA